MIRRQNDAPCSPAPRHCEDDQLRAEVAEFLSELPPEHEARVAFDRGDSTPAITHLLTDRPDINDLVRGAFRAHQRRQSARMIDHSTSGVAMSNRRQQ